MKVLLFINVLLLCSMFSCQPSFYHKSGNQTDLQDFDLTELDSTYKLYVKSICKKMVDGVAIPCNCSELSSYISESIVENEFLFLSAKKGRGVVINYIKDRNQKLFNSEKPIKAQAVPTRDTVEINVWYINQMRFGTYDQKNQEITFVVTWKPFETHVWGLNFDGNDIVVETVGKALEDGFDQKLTKLSLLFSPKFYVAKNFDLIFQNPNSDSLPNPRYRLPENKIYVDKVQNLVNFYFNSPVLEQHNIITFRSNRLYSYYPKQDSLPPSEIYRKQKMQ